MAIFSSVFGNKQEKVTLRSRMSETGMIMFPTIVYISVAFSTLLLKWALHIQICKASLKREVGVLEVRGGTKALVTKVNQ